MKNVTTLLFFFLALFTSAQSNQDSLLGIWNDDTRSDTSRLKAMHSLIWENYLFTQPDSAFVLAQKLKDFAVEKGSKEYEAEAYNTSSVSFAFRGDYATALEYNTKGLHLAEATGDSLIIAKLLSDMGAIYTGMGNYAPAFQYYQKALPINRAVGNQIYESYNLINTANLFLELEDWDKAESYYLEAMPIVEETGDKQSQSNIATGLGGIYLEKQDTIKALGYYSDGLKIALEGELLLFASTNYLHLALIYGELHQYDLALENLNQALKLAEDSGLVLNIATGYTLRGNLHLWQEKYAPAILWCEKGNKLLEMNGNFAYKINACSCLYESNKALNRASTALHYHEQLLAFQDSLKEDETKTAIQQMEFNNQLFADSIAQAEEKRLVEDAHQEELRQKNQSRNVIVGIGVLALFLAAGLFSRLRYTRRAKAVIEKEKERSENLLLNILPAEVAAELKQNGKAAARDFELASILFTDFKEFTQTSEKLSAKELVGEINYCFEGFDNIMEKYGIEKIKTIGDAYMAAGGLPVSKPESAKNTVLAALEMQDFIIARKKQRTAEGKIGFEMRCGIHSGPVVAGIVGVKKFQYDLWGDTVNTASRMESAGNVEMVNISQVTYDLIKNDPRFSFKNRGNIQVKGKGLMEMYFVANGA